MKNRLHLLAFPGYCLAMNRRAWACILCFVLLAPFAHATERPYLLHLPGIGGTMRIDRSMTSGLLEGVDADLEIYDWTCNDRGLDALLAYKRNHQQALVVAQKLEHQFREHPQTPILLTAHSGGTGIAVWALEALPADVKVDTVVLLASALSPQYNLTAALKHVSRNLYNLSSQGDSTVLGLGTQMFGTIDGIKTEAAGKIGFIVPQTAPRDLYTKLVEIPYREQWIELNNNGTHIGPMTKLFARTILSALLLHHPLPEIVVPTTQAVGE